MEFINLIINDYTLRTVSLGAALLGMVSGVVGSFAVIKKQGLIGDAISHAALPGIAIAFILTQSKNTEFFLLGALITGLLATWLIMAIDKFTRIKIDSAMAFVLSVFFGIGLVLMTYIQKIPNANQAGLEKLIFGQAATLLKRDVQLISVVGVVLIILLIVFWKELKIFSFDPEFANSIGFISNRIAIILSGMIVIAIIIGLQTVGVILMSAMIVAPGVAARQWTNRLSVMVILAGIFGAFSGFLGTVISSLVGKMPTGPAIVIVMSTIVIVSITLSPERGVVVKAIRERKQRKNINEDKVLYSLYHLASNHESHEYSHPITAIKPLKTKGGKDISSLRNVLEKLETQGFVKRGHFDRWSITDQGIVRIGEKHF